MTFSGVVKTGCTFLASLKAGNTLLLSFDSDFFFSLTPVEQRLAVLPTKYRRFSSKTEYSRNLKKLAEQIPLFAKKTYHIKPFLKHSLLSLQSKGLSFLKDFSFDRDSNKEEKIIFTFTEDKDKIAKEFVKENLPPKKESKILPCPPENPEPKKEEPVDTEKLQPWLKETLLRNWTSVREE